MRYAKLAVILMLVALAVNSVRMASGRQSEPKSELTLAGGWIAISDAVIKQLATEGKKPSWPGNTAGVSVDHTTGDANMIVPDQGVWQSHDGGVTFARVDGGRLSGRCETGYALNADPAGRRLACFMLDGKSAITLDGGKTWRTLLQHGRGWDFGAVDWSRSAPQDILALHHESGGELHLSVDGGQSWKLLGKDFTAVGIFDSGAFVASKGDGILRSVDAGASWTKVSDLTPTGRVLAVYKGVGYWATREGLLISKDRGATWQPQGSAIEAAWGPFFGRDERQIVVVGKMGKDLGIWQTQNAGRTWLRAAPFPEFARESPPELTPSKYWGAGWFVNFGWDPIGNILYASRMGHPTYRFSAHQQ